MRTMPMAGILTCILLGACGPRVAPSEILPDPAADLSSCGRPDHLPPPALAALAETIAEPLSAFAREVRFRDGWLNGHEEARAEVARDLAPLDVVIVSAKMTLSGGATRGYLTHAALVLGTEADLRALGLWDDPAILPLRDAIARGEILIEANGEAVRTTTLARLLNADGVAVLRPRGLSREAARDAIRRSVAQMGEPFDFAFDAASPEAVFCTELVDRALPGAALPRVVLYGRETILPDSIAAAALDGTAALDLVTFVHGDRDGWATGSPDLLRATIAANWSLP